MSIQKTKLILLYWSTTQKSSDYGVFNIYHSLSRAACRTWGQRGQNENFQNLGGQGDEAVKGLPKGLGGQN